MQYTRDVWKLLVQSTASVGASGEVNFAAAPCACTRKNEERENYSGINHNK